MSIDKEKVNTILVKFQQLLNQYRPNTSELQLISSKISQMTARNIVKQFNKTKSVSSTFLKEKTPQRTSRKWHKIKID